MTPLTKKNADFFNSYFSAIDAAIDSVDVDRLIEAAELIWNAHISGAKVVIVGNGGSAAMASHISVD